MTSKRVAPSAKQQYNTAFGRQIKQFIEDLGFRQVDVSKRGWEVTRKYSCAGGAHLRWMSESTLSRVVKGRVAPSRDKVDAIVLTCLYMEWEKGEARGDPPKLDEARKYWKEWRESALQGQVSNDLAVANSSAGSPATAASDPFDIEQARYGNAFGAVGLALLNGARKQDPLAALDLGVLCTLNGHTRDAERWLSIAAALGNPAASRLLEQASRSTTRMRELAAEHAYRRSREVRRQSPGDATAVVLFLEQAATNGHDEAAYLLGMHHYLEGSPGPAVRWFREAEKTGHPEAHRQVELITREIADDE